MSNKTTYTTGYEKSKLYAYVNLFKFFRRNREFAVGDYEGVFLSAKNELEQYLGKDIQEATILEIGCGQRFTATMLFHTLGATVVGIDTDFVDPRFSVKGFLRTWKENGFERFAKTFVRHILFDGA